MSTRRDRAYELAQRRQFLVARCASEREQLGQVVQEVHGQLNAIDRVVGVVRTVTSKPAVVSAAVAAFVLLGPQRTRRWITHGLLAYSTAKRLGGVWRAIRQLAIRN